MRRIAVIPGDGIGPETTALATAVIRAAGVEFEEVRCELGSDRFIRDGHVLDDDDLELLRSCDAILKGPIGPAIGETRVPLGLVERGVILKLRTQFDLYINLRPFADGHSDFIVVRENSEGSYVGEGGFVRKDTIDEIATQGSVNTRRGVDRCLRYAFDLTRTRDRRSLTLVHKTNVLTFSGDLWARAFADLAADYPDVETSYCHVDACCIYLVEDPARFDVIVTDNLFGDILTDLAGAVTGGVGFAGTANLNPERLTPSMFEPVHGSAHDSVGTDRVNPSSQILSGALLLDFLGEPAAAAKLRAALAEVSELRPVPARIGPMVAEHLTRHA